MKEFEKACEEADKERDYEVEQENCIEWIKHSKMATVTFTQGRYITKIEKLAAKFPDEVEITHRNYNREGNVSSIVAHIPVSYIKINNRVINLSEEEKRERANRLLASSTRIQ
jgi:hypothetical protein